MFQRKFRTARVAALVVASTLLMAPQAGAVPVDLTFFVDYSPSNQQRRLNLAGQMQGFLDALTADAAIDDARIAIMGSEFGSPLLLQDLTSDAALLEAAITRNLIGNGGGSRDEDYAESLIAALPGQPGFLGISYRDDAVKSLVVLADEPDQSPLHLPFYEIIFDNSDFLLNVIVPYSDPPLPFYGQYSCISQLFGFGLRISADARLPNLAIPDTGVFSICDFDNDPASFFAGFADAKITEVREESGFIGSVPEPSPVPLAATGLLALGLTRRQQGRP